MRTAGPTCPEAVVVEGEGAGTPSGSARLEAVAILQVVYRSLDELPGARGNGQGESAVQRKRKRHLIREARQANDFPGNHRHEVVVHVHPVRYLPDAQQRLALQQLTRQAAEAVRGPTDQ